jgi:hypothetical protein
VALWTINPLDVVGSSHDLIMGRCIGRPHPTYVCLVWLWLIRVHDDAIAGGGSKSGARRQAQAQPARQPHHPIGSAGATGASTTKGKNTGGAQGGGGGDRYTDGLTTLDVDKTHALGKIGHTEGHVVTL